MSQEQMHQVLTPLPPESECYTIQHVPIILTYLVPVFVGCLFFKRHCTKIKRTHRSVVTVVVVTCFTSLCFYRQLQLTSSCALRSISTGGSNINNDNDNNNGKNRKLSSYLVHCETVPIDTEPRFMLTTFPQNKKAVVDYPVWHPFVKNGEKTRMTAGKLFHQILNVDPNEAFIDVGANIGQMTLGALAGNKTTYAFDPLEYDMKKICTGIQESLDRGLVTQDAVDRLHLYRALVGKESSTNTSISRPDESFGRFEQASISAETLNTGTGPKAPKIVKEYVPMVTLDEVIPSDVPIGLVKIDVQGFEWPVVQGMKAILERESGYPKIIHYEEQEKVARAAGFKMGKVKAFLKKYGYKCQRVDRNDIDCYKD